MGISINIQLDDHCLKKSSTMSNALSMLVISRNCTVTEYIKIRIAEIHGENFTRGFGSGLDISSTAFNIINLPISKIMLQLRIYCLTTTNKNKK